MAIKKTTRDSVSKSVRETRSSQSAKIQTALYQIADAASAVTDMQSFYRKLHTIVGKLMYARNFFIALHDEKSKLITWPYHADVKDTDDVWGPQPMADYRGGTAYLLRNGQALWMKRDYKRMLKSGQFEQTGPTSADFIGIPLKGGNKILGALVVQSYTSRHTYTKQDVEILSFVAQHISTALTRARAIEETRQRNYELQIINSVQEGLASKLEMQGIYDLVGDKVRDIFDASAVTLATFELDKNILHLHYAIEKGRRNFIEPMPIPEIYMNFIRRGQPLLINNKMTEYIEEVDPGFKQLAGEMPRSVLAVPLMMKGEMFGLITLQNMDRENAFSESDMRLLQTLANSMSVALENARLFDETQQRNAELAIINSVQEGLASKLDMQEIYDLVGEKVREIFDANTVTLVTFDLDKKTIHPRYLFEKGQRFFTESTPISEVYLDFIRRGQPLLVNNRLVEYFKGIDPGFKPLAGEIPMSALAVPLKMNGEMRGLISLQNIDRENAFSESDVRLLETLANSMSVALENARLWEQEKLYRKALQRELDIGREIQQGFLPEALPVADGWEIAASLMSAREVAGDFYDAFELPDGTIGLVIADVCDKGVGAALFMTLFRSLIRAAANLDYFEQTEKADAPHSSTERLQRAISLTNNYIAETHGESGMFATLFFGILDPRDGKLRYINGGHESPLILRADNVRESLRATGPAVGVMPNYRFEIVETQLQVGDRFFAFTDGVPDCQNPHGEFFGRERLLDALGRMNGSAPDLIAGIEADLRQYIGGANQFDDITLLGVRRV